MDALDRSADLAHDVADVLGADDDGVRPGEHLAAPGGQLRVPAHRVLELGAVCLHDVGTGAGGAYGPAEEDVVDVGQIG